MTEFTPISNGWIAAFASEEQLERARKRMAYGDANKPNTLIEGSSAEDRSKGFVAEYLFDDWLTANGVDHVYNGGTDGRADFQIGSLNVATKCCGAKAAYAPSYQVVLYDVHFKPGIDYYFFFGYEKVTARFVLLGGIAASEWLSRSKPHAATDWVVPGYLALDPLRAMRAGGLVVPNEWLTQIMAEDTPAVAPIVWRVRATDDEPERWVAAEYTTAEREIMRRIARSGTPTATNEIDTLHELKVMFPGVELVLDA